MEKIKKFVKKEIVLVVAVIAAFLSMIAVPPDREYVGYINLKVLVLLFCLMIVVAGMKSTGLFDAASGALMRRIKSPKVLTAVLVALCYVSAMLITNDVALLTFVPFTIATLGTRDSGRFIRVIVLETIAANMGSMVTPIGNPQNLYLYEYYSMSIGDFMKTVLPVGLLSFIVLMTIVFCGKEKKTNPEETVVVTLRKRWKLIPYTALFLLCILTVLRIMDYRICLLSTILVIAFVDYKLFTKADYLLLLTFVAFFIFSGNLGRVEVVQVLAKKMMEGREFLTGVLVSQVISNVPAAIMLSGFTNQAQRLLLGVDVGGMGTLIASLASLISYKLYMATDGASGKRYLAVFTFWNLVMLIPTGLVTLLLA